MAFGATVIGSILMFFGACAWAQGTGAEQSARQADRGPVPARQPMQNPYGSGDCYSRAPRMPGYGVGPEIMEPGMAGQALYALSLTEDQHRQIQAIMRKHRDREWQLMGKMRTPVQDLHDAYMEDTIDTDAVVEQYDRLADLRRRMIQSQIRAHNQVQKVLTDKQRAQLRDFRRRNYYGRGMVSPGMM